jgi:hypothetical protein
MEILHMPAWKAKVLNAVAWILRHAWRKCLLYNFECGFKRT